ncbi:MAG TPA: hypothetical protein VGD69_19960 [Herpetosiphonaceae bacterium]
MLWVRTKRGLLVANLGAYRGVVDCTATDRTWSAHIEAPDQIYHADRGFPSAPEAKAWVEQRIETLLATPRSSSR